MNLGTLAMALVIALVVGMLAAYAVEGARRGWKRWLAYADRRAADRERDERLDALVVCPLCGGYRFHRPDCPRVERRGMPVWPDPPGLKAPTFDLPGPPERKVTLPHG